MDPKKFEQLVKDGIEEIPEKFLRLLDNVGIVIEDKPTREQRKKLHVHDGMTLFGLYEGVPHIRRGQNYFGVLPDKITIFMEPILESAENEEEVREIVRDTVWHEIAHHFGFDEKEVRKAEKKRKQSVLRQCRVVEEPTHRPADFLKGILKKGIFS